MRSRVSLLSVAVLKLAGLNTTVPREGSSGLTQFGQECLVKWNDINMHFLKHPLRPLNGAIRLPEAPGARMALDPDKIEHAEEVRV
jgi:hypothetical protein